MLTPDTQNFEKTFDELKRDTAASAPPISQEHTLGCAVACVAYRLGISYSEALSRFRDPQNAWKRGYYCGEVVEALKQGGLLYQFSEYTGNQLSAFLEREGTFVFLEPNVEYPSGHYLIRTAAGWMNPWTNFPQMIPVQSAIVESLPGRVAWVIFEIP
jgi:hypothetical protein